MRYGFFQAFLILTLYFNQEKKNTNCLQNGCLNFYKTCPCSAFIQIVFCSVIGVSFSNSYRGYESEYIRIQFESFLNFTSDPHLCYKKLQRWMNCKTRLQRYRWKLPFYFVNLIQKCHIFNTLVLKSSSILQLDWHTVNICNAFYWWYTQVLIDIGAKPYDPIYQTKPSSQGEGDMSHKTNPGAMGISQLSFPQSRQTELQPATKCKGGPQTQTQTCGPSVCCRVFRETDV